MTMQPFENSSPTDRRRRFAGVAEIELLVGAVVMLAILLLTRGALDVAQARSNAEHEAWTESFLDATRRSTPLHLVNEPEPVQGFSVERPGLPLRMHGPQVRREVRVIEAGGNELAPVRLGTDYWLPSPAWTWDGRPNRDDGEIHRRWFMDYVMEQHFEVHEPLGLAAPYPP